MGTAVGPLPLARTLAGWNGPNETAEDGGRSTRAFRKYTCDVFYALLARVRQRNKAVLLGLSWLLSRQSSLRPTVGEERSRASAPKHWFVASREVVSRETGASPNIKSNSFVLFRWAASPAAEASIILQHLHSPIFPQHQPGRLPEHRACRKE